MKKAFIQLHIAILLAGFTGILGRLIELHEGWLVWYRMVLSALILWGLLYFTKRLTFPGKKDVLKFFGIGAIISLHWISFYGSIKYSNVSVAVTCYSAIGFFTSFTEPLIRRRRIDIKEVLLGILVICGIFLIFNFYPEFKKGIIFGLIGALLGSVFPILNKPLVETHNPLVLNLYEMTGGVIMLILVLPVYLYFFPAPYYLPTVMDWFWLLILSGLCTVFAFDFGLKALQKLSAFTVNLSFIFEPVYSVILAFIIFKENKFLNYGFYIGFGLIILAVTIQTIRVYQKNKEAKRRPTKRVIIMSNSHN